MAKPFFYRIDAAEFVAAVLQIPDGHHKQWVTQLALDMVSGVGTIDFSKKIIEEVGNYRKKQAEAGAKGGKPKHKQPYSDPIAGGNDTTTTLKQNIASSSSSSSSSTVTEAVTEAVGRNSSDVPLKRSRPARQKNILSDEDWMQSLKTTEAYDHINISSEYSKMMIWCQNKNKQPTRTRFINWLNRIEKPLNDRRRGDVTPQQPNIQIASPAVSVEQKAMIERAQAKIYGNS